jgi:SAM-dependent methyltransferase
MSEVYEKWIDAETVFKKTESQRALGYFTYLSSELIRVCRLFARPPMSLTFLDYSMGWGHWCRAAHGLGCTAHGTEYSPSRVAYAKAHGVKVVDEHKLEPRRYDFINTEQVFEHLPDPLTTLKRLRAALAPGGILRISVPNGADILDRLWQADWSIPRGHPGSLVAVAPLEHVNCFNRTCLVQMALRCHLRPIWREIRKRALSDRIVFLCQANEDTNTGDGGGAG